MRVHPEDGRGGHRSGDLVGCLYRGRYQILERALVRCDDGLSVRGVGPGRLREYVFTRCLAPHATRYDEQALSNVWRCGRGDSLWLCHPTIKAIVCSDPVSQDMLDRPWPSERGTNDPFDGCVLGDVAYCSTCGGHYPDRIDAICQHLRLQRIRDAAREDLKAAMVNPDPEEANIQADLALCGALDALGFGELVEAYKKVKVSKWFD